MVKANYTKKKKNCIKGWQCGNSCISKSKNCRVVVTKSSKEILEKYAKSLNSPELANIAGKKSWSQADVEIFNNLSKKDQVSVAISAKKAGNNLEPIKNQKAEPSGETKLAPINNNFVPKPNRPEDEKKLKELLEHDDYLKDKTNKNLGVDGLTFLESAAMSTWVSEYYHKITKHVLQGKSNGLGQIAANNLSAAIVKSPRYSKEAATKSLGQKGKFNEGEYPLVRKMSMNLKNIKKYLTNIFENKTEDDIFKSNTYDAYSFSTGITSWSGNVVLKTKPKEGGQSKAGLVDKYKNKLYEAEALYPINTDFKIKSIKYNNAEITSVETIPELMTGLYELEILLEEV